MRKVRKETELLNQALKRGLIDQTTYNNAINSFGKTSTSAFSGAAQSLAAFGARFVGITALISTAVTGLRDVRTNLDELGRQQREDAPGLGELQQLTDDPDEMRRMVADAKKTFAEGGTKTLGEAGQVQFALESAGLGQYRKEMSDLLATKNLKGFEDAKELIDSISAIMSSMGESETGDFQAVVSKAFGASKIAPARIHEILAAAASSGSQAQALGIGDEELLASVAAIAKIEKGAAPAGTQMESLLKQIEKFGIGGGYLEGGKSLQEQVAAIDALVKDGYDVRDILGDRQEGIKAFRALANPETGGRLFTEAMQNIVSDQETNAFARRVQVAREAVPEVIAASVHQQSTARAQLAGEDKATWATLAETLRSEIIANSRQGSFGEIGATVQRAGIWWDRMTETDEFFVKSRLGEAPSGTRQQIEAAERAMAETAKSMQEAADNLRNATGDTSRAGAARANQAAAGGAVEAR
jgi:hypothetical protein